MASLRSSTRLYRRAADVGRLRPVFLRYAGTLRNMQRIRNLLIAGLAAAVVIVMAASTPSALRDSSIALGNAMQARAGSPTLSLRTGRVARSRSSTSGAPASSQGAVPSVHRSSGGETAATLPQAAGPSARALTTGYAVLRDASSATSGTFVPKAGSRIFVWVSDLVSGQPAPIPVVSGGGLSFKLLASITKNGQSARRLSLFTAVAASAGAPMKVTFRFGQSLPQSEWIWSVVQTGQTKVSQLAVNSEGGFVTAYSVTFPRATRPGATTIGGFIVGMGGYVSPDPRLRQAGQAHGTQPAASILTEWGGRGYTQTSCSWQKPAHSLGIAIEVGSL